MEFEPFRTWEKMMVSREDVLLCPNSLLFASDVTLPHQTPKETTHEVACLAGLRPSRRSPKLQKRQALGWW
jgi:hypothetical protein